MYLNYYVVIWLIWLGVNFVVLGFDGGCRWGVLLVVIVFLLCLFLFLRLSFFVVGCELIMVWVMRYMGNFIFVFGFEVDKKFIEFENYEVIFLMCLN